MISNFKKKRQQSIVGQAAYLQSSTPELPENYTMHDGFLFRGDTPVSLLTSGIVESAVRGFLHVEKIEQYKTK
ncbi:hypothetical protein [Dehalobacter sp.]|uniref:hypothetical protein n=1 Tax=Dehalobacter sp. TaxID=1962289 RepID=UPI00258DE870|nr:hypothetical protein [Dehalobacter sp.]MDJ0305628.1 hypothetical protein [Dehalobacter sp.]